MTERERTHAHAHAKEREREKARESEKERREEREDGFEHQMRQPAVRAHTQAHMHTQTLTH